MRYVGSDIAPQALAATITFLTTVEHLQGELERLLETLSDADQIRDRLASLVSVYPFNEYEFIISTLMARSVLSLDEYLVLRSAYSQRNRYRPLFALSPTPFGITWAEAHVRELVPEIKKPASGEYDLLLNAIRVEVNASRAVDRKSRKHLVEKALVSNSPRQFVMNFQQTKPKGFDVIVWIGVWLDRIRYWTLSSDEVATHRRFSAKQHRGNKGEGQLHVTDKNIHDFAAYEAQADKLADAIRTAFRRKHS